MTIVLWQADNAIKMQLSKRHLEAVVYFCGHPRRWTGVQVCDATDDDQTTKSQATRNETQGFDLANEKLNLHR